MHQLSGLYFVFLVDADLDRFLRFLENLSKKKGIHLLSVRFHPTSDDHKCGKKKRVNSDICPCPQTINVRTTYYIPNIKF